MEIVQKSISAFLALAMVLTMLPMPAVRAAEEQLPGETAPVETLPALETLQIPDETAVAAETEVVPETTVAVETVAETTVPVETAPEATEEETEATEPEETANEGTVPEVAAVEETEIDSRCGNNLIWSFDESTGTLTISGTGAMYDYAENEAPWKYFLEEIEKIVVEDGVTALGNGAFFGCVNAKDVQLPEKLEALGEEAFRECTGLESIALPDNVMEIGYGTFAGCESLQSVQLPEQLESLGTAAFDSCSSLTGLELPESVNYIGTCAFGDCEKLEKIVFTGNAPEFANFALTGVITTCCYPANDSTWTEDIFGLFDEDITWLPYKPNIPTEGTCGEKLTWVFDEASGILTISGSGDMTEYAKAGDAPWYGHRKEINRVIIPEGVTSIGSYAFADCNVWEVRKSSKLNETWQFPDSVETIGDHAFEGCAFANLFLPDELMAIGAYAFANCKELHGLTIPESVVHIGSNAFAGCSSVGNVKIMSETITIGDGAFSGSSFMFQLILENAEFGKRVFDGCEGLKEITFKGEASSFAADTFQGVTARAYYPLYETGWTPMVLKDYGGSIQWLGYEKNSGYCGETVTWGFNEKKGTLIISGTGEMYENNLEKNRPWEEFEDKIVSVVIEDGVTGNLQYAFYGCENLKSVQIPEGITVIGNSAFEGCKKLEEVTLPKSVTAMGWSVFEKCESLKEITFVGNAPAFHEESFYGVTATVNYPANNTSWTAEKRQNYGGQITWKGYQDENLVSGTCGEKVYWELNLSTGTLRIWGEGEMADYEQNGEPWHAYQKQITTVTVDEGITSVGNYAFRWYDNLTTVVLPDSLNQIGSYAFAYCVNLKDIDLPENLTDLGYYAFSNCNSLKSVMIPSSAASSSGYAFAYCNNLEIAIFSDGATRIPYGIFSGCDNLSSVTIPESVTVIEASGFYGCDSLTNVTIPEKVMYIGKNAFCSSGLQKVIIPKSVEMIGNQAFGSSKLSSVVFLGESCEIEENAFYNVTADVSCPASWTEDMRKDYGGKLTWHILEEFCFLLQPEDCVTAVGAEAVFTALASEDARYQWSWSADGKTWTPIEGANGMELKLTAKTQHTGQLFRCEATNGEGKTAISTAASLSLYSQVETDSSFDVKIGNREDIVYFAFIPEHTDYYTFCTDEEDEITLAICDGSRKILAADTGKSDWMNGVYYTAEIMCKLEAGQTYILSAKYASSYATGNFRAELKTSHDDSKAVVTPATCTKDGSKTFACALCGEEIKEVIPATGHTMGEGKVVEEPNCYKQGVLVYTCTVCKEEIAEWIPIRHTYEDMDETCDICGYTGTYMPELKLGCNTEGLLWYWYVPEYTHSYTLRSNSPIAVCGVYSEDDNLLVEAESNGAGLELHCILEAGRKYIIKVESLYEGVADYYTTIEFAMNHSYETVEPDSCADGKIIHTCTDCGEIFREEMEHTWNDGTILIEATCTSDGFTAYTCTVCGKSRTERITGEHIWQSVTTEATCEADGQIVHTCTVCQTQKKEILPGGHDYEDSYNSESIGLCTRCGKARSAEGTCGELTWVLEDRKLTVSGKGAVPDYTEYNSQIPWKEYSSEIVAITLSEGITRIGDYAFRYCNRAQSIALPESLKEIGTQVFYNCGFTEIYIPAGVHTIGDGAFVSCDALAGITVAGNNKYYVNDEAGNLYTKDKTVLIAVSGNLSDTFILPEGVESVRPSAFNTTGNGIQMVIFPKSLKEIPSKLLDDFDRIEGFWFSGDAPIFGETAFEGFYDRVFYPESNETWTSVIQNNYGGSPEWIGYQSEYINAGNFGDALHWELSSDGVLTISGKGEMPNFGYDYATDDDLLPPWEAYKNLITAVVIEKGVTSIGNEAFYQHSSIVSVEIPDGITSIGDRAFDSCSSLKAVSIPKSVKKFGWSIFLDCENLVSAELPEGMTVIPDTMFGRCYALSEVNIPSTVTAIEPTAFSNCHSLEKVTLPKGLTYIEYWAFRGTAIKEIVIPDKVTYLGKSAFASCEELTSVKLPKSLQSIGANAFAYCSKLPGIDIPNTVKYIGWGAFCYCTSLTDVTIPDGIAYLGGTFMGCDNLKSVNIPDSVKTLAYFAFYDCSSLTALDMPEKLEIIEHEVFSGSGIQEMTVPENVASLDYNVFKDSALEKITFTGDAPKMVLDEYYNGWESGTFVGAEADAYYPAYNATWTKKVLSANYGGSINWIPYGDDVPVTGMCGEHLTWTYDPETDTLTIAGYGDMDDYSPEDPAPWAQYREKIRRIILPDGITSIGDYAFYGCDNVEKILIAKTVTSIGKGAFCNCAGLKEITFAGDAPAKVGTEAFAGVTAAVMYPGDNVTWNAAVMQNYGGTLTWKPAEGNDYQLGDVNHDGKINAKDATLILQKSVGVLKPTAKFCEECAEVSGDGKLNAKDSTLILQFSVGLRDSFPAQEK